MSVAAKKRAVIEATKLRAEPPDAAEILSRYLSGESMQVLAKECGTYRRKLYRLLFSEFGGEQYREIVTEALIARMADADDEMELAAKGGDPVRVTAAREMQRFTRMDFERRRPGLYGPKQEIKHSGGGVWRIEIAGPGDMPGRVLEQAVEPAQLEAPKEEEVVP